MSNEVADWFDYLDTDRLKQSAIRLKIEPFTDIVYVYGTVKFIEPKDPSEQLTLKFDYDILKNPYKPDELNKTKLIQIMGDILVYILTWQAETGKLELNGPNDRTKPNQKSSSQRGLFALRNPFSKA